MLAKTGWIAMPLGLHLRGCRSYATIRELSARSERCGEGGFCS